MNERDNDEPRPVDYDRWARGVARGMNAASKARVDAAFAALREWYDEVDAGYAALVAEEDRAVDRIESDWVHRGAE